MKILSTAPNRPRRRFARALVAFAAAAIILGSAPASAMASTASAPTVSGISEVVAASAASAASPVYTTSFTASQTVLPKLGAEGNPCVTCAGEAKAGTQSKLIPINRWTSAVTKLHNRPNGRDPLGLAASAARMSSQQALLSFVSAVWAGTAFLADFSAELKPVDLLGYQVDHATGQLGAILFANPLIFVLTAFGLLIGAIWNKSRGRDATGLLKRALGVVLVLIAIGSMSAGGSRSTNDGGNYVPGVASPGWIITEISTVIGAATNAALAGFTDTVFAPPASTPNGVASATANNGQLTCVKYIKNIKDLYTDKKIGNTSSMGSISAMWETSGLRTWVTAQFGANNIYADQVWCHQADHIQGISVKKQLDYTLIGVEGAQTLRDTYGWGKSLAFQTSNGVDEDRNGIAWAACQWNGKDWTVQDGFKQRLKHDRSAGMEDWISKGDCESWWNGSQPDLKALHFNIGTGEFEQDADTLSQLTEDDGVQDFASSWQGTDIGLGSTTIIIWSIVAAIILFLILGAGLSGAVAVAKLLTVVVMMMMMLVMVGSLFSTEGPGPRIIKMLKQVIGYTVLASGASAIFVVIMWMTQLLISLGAVTLGPGTVGSLIWTALAPVIAMIVLHMLFKKFNVPSPLSPKGALAWGAAGGAAGGIIGSGIVNRLGGKAKNVVGKAVEGRGSSLLHSATRGKYGEAAQGASRPGAGSPPPLGGKPGKGGAAGGGKAGKAADRETLRQARDYDTEEVRGQKIPETAGQRADRRVRAAARATLTTTGRKEFGDRVSNAIAPVVHEIRGIPKNAAFIAKNPGPVARAVLSSAGNASKQALTSAATTVKTDAVKKYEAFKANPVTATWQGTKAVGHAAKVGAGYAGLGILAASTGGAAIPVAAAVISGKRGVAKKNERRAEEQRLIVQHQDHLKAQAKNEKAVDKYQEKARQKSVAEQALRPEPTPGNPVPRPSDPGNS